MDQRPKSYICSDVSTTQDKYPLTFDFNSILVGVLSLVTSNPTQSKRSITDLEKRKAEHPEDIEQINVAIKKIIPIWITNLMASTLVSRRFSTYEMILSILEDHPEYECKEVIHIIHTSLNKIADLLASNERAKKSALRKLIKTPGYEKTIKEPIRNRILKILGEESPQTGKDMKKRKVSKKPQKKKELVSCN